jgi:cytochrome c peroxidase
MRNSVAFLVCVCLLAACDGSTSDRDGTDAALRSLIEAYGLTGDPAAGHDLPSIDDPRAVLGRRLFFSKSLGGDLDSACVSCHHPALGGGDALALSIGVGADDPDLLGPGRTHPDGDLTVPRNAPTTFNIAFWDKGLFWDSRVEELDEQRKEIRTPDSDFGTADPDAGESIVAAQARFPVTSADEMRGFEFVKDGTNAEVRTALEQRLTEDGGWAAEFEVAFGTPEITYGRIAEAIAAYEQSQVFTDTPWRAYVEGDNDAIGQAARRGALLFFRGRENGGAGCASCHSGDFFTNEQFSSICAPQIGRGKGDGATETSDFGRERETSNLDHRFTFRIPTLLNVSVTGPYLHSGAYDNLADVVRHHLDPVAAADNYDPTTVPQAAVGDFDENLNEMLDHLQLSDQVIETFRTPLDYGEQDIQDLVAFLETLTDPCVMDRECLAPWIADPETDDVDGNLLVAHDADGNPL